MDQPVSRRNFVKLSGAILGGVAFGSQVTVAQRADRFIVDTQNVQDGQLEEGVDVEHDLQKIDLAVVNGSESELGSITDDYAPDTEFELDLPVEHVDVDDGNVDQVLPLEQSALDETYYPLQWDKQVQQIPQAHNITRGEGSRVAVIDTGVAAGHPDLEGAVNEDLSRNLTGDDYGTGGPYGGFHGTHVAGIIAANDRNVKGVVGSAPGAEIVDYRVFSSDASASFADIVAAIYYAAEIESDVANVSLGTYPITREALGRFYEDVLERVSTHANDNGTLVVVAAGNDAGDIQHDGQICVEADDGSEDCFSAVSLPSEAANVLTISATGPIGFRWNDSGLVKRFDSPAYYTNYGTNAIDLGAPGGNADTEAIDDVEGWFLDLVVSTVAEPQFEDDEYVGADYSYGWAAGTSMAAPQVAGAIALVRSISPDATTGRVESILESTAAVPNRYEQHYFGAGFLDPLAAVNETEERRQERL